MKLFLFILVINLLMFNWEPIFTEASQANTSLVYLAIGSAMGNSAMVNYTQTNVDPTNANSTNVDPTNVEIPDDKNQQYPPFLPKFRGRKMIILIDPFLEKHLAVEKYMKKHNIKFTTNIRNNVRVLQSEEIVVYAIEEKFEFVPNTWGTPEEIKKSVEKSSSDVSNLINLIEICLGKRTRTRIIVQDFTGRDTTKFYCELFNIFDKTELLNNVLFDVTQKDGGCYVELNDRQASLDSNQNFIQEKYMELTNIINSPLFHSILNERIHQIIYPISYNFINLRKLNSHEIVNKDKLIMLAQIYNINIDEFNKSPDYLIQIHEQLIVKVLEDVVRARQIDFSVVESLMSIIDQRSAFINALTVLSYN